MLINGIERKLRIRAHKNKSIQLINVNLAEQFYKSKYLGDFCTKNTEGGWNELPVALFYNKNPDISKGHTHYFGLFAQDRSVLITDGSSVADEPIIGIVADNGEVVFSRYRHDHVTSTDESVWIDGGRDYIRTNKIDRLVSIQLIDGELVIQPTKDSYE